MGYENILSELWNLILTLLEYISNVFDWLFKPLELSIDIPITIPYLLENGISWSWDLGVTPVSLLGVGLVGLVIYWLVWA